MSQRLLFTIGHSIRPWPEFLALLRAWKIQQLVDVRTIPRSRAFPWFDIRRMKTALLEVGIRYLHLPDLGGLRHARKDSPNAAWRNASFRGYADYMQTPAFDKALRQLNALRQRRRTCIMCSEAVWWRCHRRMIADAEIARHIPVRHIMSATAAKPHAMTPFAQLRKPRGKAPQLSYPEPGEGIKSR